MTAKPHTKLGKQAIRRKKPVTETVYFPADEAQGELHRDALQKRQLAMFTGDAEQLEQADAKLAEVREAIAEEGVVMTFKALGRRRFDELILEHPPTDKQRAEDETKPEGERRTFDPDTFWPALLCESVDSTLTAEEWRTEVFDNEDWNAAECKLLRDTAQQVSMSTRVADLGN